MALHHPPYPSALPVQISAFTNVRLIVKLIECVPNFSEGRDRQVIQAISDAISHIRGVHLLHVDASVDANRTVMTFVGEPAQVGEAAFQAIAKAAEQIDMSHHKGQHPRQGATDVCPFVPLSGVEMVDCIELAKNVGERVGEELDIPVYLYGQAATDPSRRSLATVRKGEYEALPEKLIQPESRPDYGPVSFNPQAGAIAVGAREILVAFNVCLDTNDTSQAQDIAMAVRERGKVARDSAGRIIRNDEGDPIFREGTLKACRAIGWWIPAYDCTQVSMNLENYRLTPPHMALEEIRCQAHLRNLQVTGSELVGMVPLAAMLMAGYYYSTKKDNAQDGTAEELVVRAADAMQLSAVKRFKPERDILEYRLQEEGGSWVGWAQEIMASQSANNRGFG
jgi:glutamate formiminotransferase/formiminotetrahydrofolate cyclodeaminase